VFGFAFWREGLVLRPGLEGTVRGLADLAERGLRLVNRVKGSEARRVLAGNWAGPVRGKWTPC
jgi:molybdate-binding protein